MLGDIYVLPFWPPFLIFWGLNTIFLGYFFLSTNTKKLILGTNPSRITSFWPQIPLCLDLLGSNFQRPVAHPHQSPDLVPHKHSTPTPTQSPTHPTKTIKFFVAHTVNYVKCNNHTRIDWILLNFTPVIQQNYHQPGRKFEKLFCAVDRLSCQLELWKSETSQFRSDVVFDIVNYVHLIFFHGSKCCFEIFNEFRLLCCLNFMGQECAGIAPESSRFWQHFYAVFTSTETIFCPTSLTISGATWAPTRLGPIKL